MLKLTITYLIAFILFFVIDMLWLGLIAKAYYKAKLGFILSPNQKWKAAMVFYLIYVGGILFFAINPSLKEMDWSVGLINGAVFGAMCYATYDLTNMATIAKWPIEIVIIDIIWGTTLTSIVALASYFLVGKLFQ